MQWGFQSPRVLFAPSFERQHIPPGRHREFARRGQRRLNKDDMIWPRKKRAEISCGQAQGKASVQPGVPSLVLF